MVRTKADGRVSTSTRTSHPGPFVRVGASPSVGGNTSNARGTSPARGVPPSSPKKGAKKGVSKSAKAKTGSKKGVAKPSKADKGLKKPKRFRPGTVALREIKKYQKTFQNLIPRARFQRMTREILNEGNGLDEGSPVREATRFRAEALQALQDGMEYWAIRVLECANLASIHGKRVTVMPKDIALVGRLKQVKC
eukprot:PhM_4_TR16080/c5_g1_i1/m.38340/K11253/H3; histone H3